MKHKTKEEEILAFAESKWGHKPMERVVVKLSEEVGEVCGAVVKIEETRATTEDLRDELGDVLIVLSQMAAKLDTTLEELRATRFKKVQFRNSSLPSA